MNSVRSGAGLGLALLFVLCLSPAAPAAAQGANSTHKSVYGKLERVDQGLSGIFMRTNEGKRMAWRFDRAVIDQLSEFKPGDPIIVIYRQQGGDKAVTAIAFPGATPTPVYVNSTGQRVEFFSGPMVNGACGLPADTPLNQSTIPIGGRAEGSDACWCCAPAGELCIPGNKTGQGKAFITRCYK
jgi:hypothetical protein